MQLADFGAHRHAQLRVEIGKRLVEEEELRLAHDRPPDRHSLPLAAGKLLRLAVEQVLQAEDLGGLLHPGVDLLFRDLPDLQAEAHVVPDVHVRVQGIALEHHGDVPVLRRHVVDERVADVDLAGADGLEACDHPQRRRLAAARRTDEHGEFLVLDGDRQVVDGLDRAPLLDDVLEGDGSHQAGPFAGRFRIGARNDVRFRGEANPAVAAGAGRLGTVVNETVANFGLRSLQRRRRRGHRPARHRHHASRGAAPRICAKSRTPCAPGAERRGARPPDSRWRSAAFGGGLGPFPWDAARNSPALVRCGRRTSQPRPANRTRRHPASRTRHSRGAADPRAAPGRATCPGTACSDRAGWRAEPRVTRAKDWPHFDEKPKRNHNATTLGAPRCRRL